jgi:hypothetical protein
MICSYAEGRAFRPAKCLCAWHGTAAPFWACQIVAAPAKRCAATAIALKRVRVFNNKQFGDNVVSVYS